MKKNIFGRKNEMQELQRCIESGKSELVVIYGRRRVGKTFMVNEFFGGRYAFSYVGRRGVTKSRQLKFFANALQQYARSEFQPELKDWFDAFDHLQTLLSSCSGEGKKVVFIDEMPWMDTHRSDFVAAIESFWNGWAALRHDVLLIVCGSATSWIVDKLLHNKGGLFSRVTKQIYLRPFRLAEVEELLLQRGCSWDRYQIALCYMVMGGIPYYLTLLDSGKSFAQNMDELFFSGTHAPLLLEYEEMYQSLFAHSEKYVTVMRKLSEHREGLSRQELVKKTKISGAGLTTILSDLERCDFIFSYSRYGSKVNKVIYRVKDFYSLFYFRFLEKNDTKDTHYWTHLLQSPKCHSWQGFSFELLALLHLEEIKKKLGLHTIYTEASVWRSSDESSHAQIDLVIKRADRIINLCEMKFSGEIYSIDKAYAQYLLERKSRFVAATKTRYGVALTMVTTYGILKNQHSGIVSSEVTLDDLFEKL